MLFCLMRQNRHSFLAFPKFNMAMFILQSEAKALLELFCHQANPIGRIDQVTTTILPPVVIGKPKQYVHKALHCDSKQQLRSPNEITLLLLVHTTYTWVSFFVHIPFMVNRTFNTMSTKRLQQHLLFTTNHTDSTFSF